MTLIDGLEGGRWALATKTHHCLVDGVGSLDIADALLDVSPEAAPVPLQPLPNGHGEVTEHDNGRFWLSPGLVLRGARAGVGAALHPRESIDRVRAAVELIVRDEVIGAPQSSLNGPMSGTRHFATVRVDLADVKATKARLGGTVNDVVLALCAGGLRHLLLSRGEGLPQGDLRAQVPVNIRSEDSGSRSSRLSRSRRASRPTSPLRRVELGAAQGLSRQAADDRDHERHRQDELDYLIISSPPFPGRSASDRPDRAGWRLLRRAYSRLRWILGAGRMGDGQSVSAAGSSSSSRMRARNSAASAPYRMRWSQARTSVIVLRAITSPSRTTARGTSAPTDRIAACGGLMIAVKLLDAVHPEVRHGERAAAQLRRGDRARAHALGQRARLAGDLAQRLGRPRRTPSAPPARPPPPTATPTLTREYSCTRPSR